MNKALKVLALGAAIAASATMAKADTMLATTTGSFATSTIGGTYTEDVWQSTATGDLYFTILLDNTGGPSGVLGPIDSISLGNPSLPIPPGVGFHFFTNTVSYSGSGVDPTSDTLDSNGTYNFNFMGGLPVGDSSALITINTNATNYTAGSLGFIDSTTSTDPGFIPTAVPEPSSLALLGTTLLGAAGVARRRFFRT